MALAKVHRPALPSWIMLPASMVVPAGRGLSVEQLKILVAHWAWRAEATLDDREPDPGEAPGEMHLSPVQNRWVLKGDLSAEQGETVNVAVNAVAEALRTPSGETRSPAQQRADALTAICRFWLENNQKVTIHSNRPQVTVIVNVEDLARGAHGPGGVTPGGTWFDGATVARLACDAVLTRVLMSGSVVLNVGRATKTIPAYIRRAVIARDRHCRYPECDRPVSWSDVHHVVPLADGGPHSAWSSCLFCKGHHHDRIHRLGETVTLSADGTVTVTGADGVARMSHPPPDAARLFRADGTPRGARSEDPVRRAREHDAVVAAVEAVHRAATWTDADHQTAERVVTRLHDLHELGDRINAERAGVTGRAAATTDRAGVTGQRAFAMPPVG